MFFCDHEQACGPMVHIIEVIEEKKMFLTVIMGIMVMEAHIFQKYYCIHSHSNDCSQGLYDIHTTHFVLWGTARNIFFQMVIFLYLRIRQRRDILIGVHRVHGYIANNFILTHYQHCWIISVSLLYSYSPS